MRYSNTSPIQIAQQTQQKSGNTFKNLISTSQEYKQKCVDLNKKHQKEKEELQSELESEIQNLQKKIISYSKQEGIANFKKSLESMLTMDENEAWGLEKCQRNQIRTVTEINISSFCECNDCTRMLIIRIVPVGMLEAVLL